MNSQKVAGALGGLIALVALIYALAYGPKESEFMQAKQPDKVELPQPAAAETRPKGPVVTEVPQ